MTADDKSAEAALDFVIQSDKYLSQGVRAAIADTLTNIMHLCLREQIPFGDLLRQAEVQFEEETTS